ncbi:MAG: VOC family protein [Candidatus Woesearchaeota archaeon]|nr:VOC family protein [Candidatus Woesearchaeota archaeon]
MKPTKNKKLLVDDVRIGHIHLKVSNLDRAIAFYRDILGFEITARYGESAAFLSAGGYHHHIGLNTWESLDGKQPEEGTTGLYHFAILFPSRKELSKALRRLIENKWPIDGAADHGVSEAIYLMDPDGNGIEIYADRPKDKWEYDGKGNVIMYTKKLDLKNLIKEPV